MVFPEAWLAGYPYWTEGWDSSLPQWAGGRILFRDNALVVPSEDTERIAHAARKAGIYVVLGCNEMDPRPEVSTIYNSLIFFAPDGSVHGPAPQADADLHRAHVLGPGRRRRPAWCSTPTSAASAG